MMVSILIRYYQGNSRENSLLVVRDFGMQQTHSANTYWFPVEWIAARLAHHLVHYLPPSPCGAYEP